MHVSGPFYLEKMHVSGPFYLEKMHVNGPFYLEMCSMTNGGIEIENVFHDYGV